MQHHLQPEGCDDRQVTEGTSLAATINYNLEGFVFVPGITDLGAASLTDLLAAATLTPLHAREKFGPGPASAEFSSASVALALGHEPHAPCGSPDNWDGGAGPPPAASAPRVGAGDAGAAGPGDTGPNRGADGPGQGMADTRPSSGNGPGPSDAADGIHPATSLPPGCVPDMAIRLTVDGQACAHKACAAPEWQPIPYTPWSSKSYKNAGGRDCSDYCVSQFCPDGTGITHSITCRPSCP